MLKGEEKKMKKILSVLLVLGMVLSLTACGASGSSASGEDPAPVSVSDETEVSASVSNDPEPVSEPVAISEEDVIDAFNVAQGYWFKIEGALSADYNDSITGTINGFDNEFYRVNEPGMSTYDELVNSLSEYVDASFVKDYIDTHEMFMDQDGALYICPAGRGDDLTLAWVEYAVNLEGEKGVLTLTIHRQDYFDALDDWYETGETDQQEFSFTVSDGHAVFDEMVYVYMNPEEAPIAGHDPDSLEAALIGLLAGTWTDEDGHSYVIEADGSFVSYYNDEENSKGYIVSSRSNDGSYMMSGEDFNNTVFVLGKADDGSSVITFDSGSIVFTKED